MKHSFDTNSTAPYDHTHTHARTHTHCRCRSACNQPQTYTVFLLASSVTSRGRQRRFCKSMYAGVWGGGGGTAHASCMRLDWDWGQTVALAGWWSLQCARARTRVGALASPVAIRQGELTLQIERSFGSHFSSWRKASAVRFSLWLIQYFLKTVVYTPSTPCRDVKFCPTISLGDLSWNSLTEVMWHHQINGFSNSKFWKNWQENVHVGLENDWSGSFVLRYG